MFCALGVLFAGKTLKTPRIQKSSILTPTCAQLGHFLDLAPWPGMNYNQWGKSFYLQLELFYLQLSFIAYSPLGVS